MAHRVVDHINTLIANNPAATQQYIYEYIAIELRLSHEQVASAVAGGGHTAVTVHVSDEGRRALASELQASSFGSRIPTALYRHR